MGKLEHIPVDLDLLEIKEKLRLDPSENMETLIKIAQPLIKARALYKVSYVEDRLEDTVRLDGVRFKSRVLRTNLGKAERVFPYVVTIGQDLEDRAASCNDLLEQYYLDTIGNLAITAARRFLENHLRDVFHPGKISRMNPGSLSDWPIQEQKPLFSILGDVDAAIGVRLTESYLMIPRKSLSGIYFPTEISFLSCQLCPRKECPSRQAAYDRTLAMKYGVVE